MIYILNAKNKYAKIFCNAIEKLHCDLYVCENCGNIEIQILNLNLNCCDDKNYIEYY